ncbi:unnamed protein product [Pelagomonas calceolata]|uniref:ATP phosphoribosyltransferase n=1 Tax=Pelagomonas calceolata TaxID=35677 RepID=A0A7S3ZWN9_9STRA|nr:unnamed protein product [Pelagomonas calceolata]
MHRIALSTARAPVAAAAAAAYYGSRPREAACDPQLVPHPERHDRRGELLFGVPKKGRLHEKIVGMLKGAGLEYKREARLDIAHCRDLPVSLVFLPAADIATYVGEGDVDMGITGEDIIAESEVDVIELMRLGMGKCRLSVQAPAGSTQDPRQLAGKRVVTSFPVLTKKYFAGLETGAETKVKCISGSVEASCGLGLADGIVDLVETGTTMRAAGLEEVSVIMHTETVLIANPHSHHKELIELLRKRISGFITASRYMMVTYNVPRHLLHVARQITPGKKSPSIQPLEDEAWVAVSALVEKSKAATIMDSLEAAGATDILLSAIHSSRMGD